MNYFESQMLAGAALGMTEDQIEVILDDDEDFDSPLMEKFGVDLEQFTKIAEALLPLTPMVQSELSNEILHAFGRRMGSGWLAITTQKAE
jgi:hypothetical protein